MTHVPASADLTPKSIGVPADAIAWHYTTGLHFIRIVQSGALVWATAFVPHHEKPAVWFTLDQFWEPTANKGWRENDGTVRTLTREETCEKCSGLVRVGVSLETAKYDWREFKKRSRIHPRAALALAQEARRVGSNPDNWRVTFRPVPSDEWVAVDVWDQDQNCWVRVEHRREVQAAEGAAS